MPKFLVEAVASHSSGNWRVSATSRQSLEKALEMLNGTEIYIGEHLQLSITREISKHCRSQPLKEHLSGLYVPKDLIEGFQYSGSAFLVPAVDYTGLALTCGTYSYLINRRAG